MKRIFFLLSISCLLSSCFSFSFNEETSTNLNDSSDSQTGASSSSGNFESNSSSDDTSSSLEASSPGISTSEHCSLFFLDDGPIYLKVNETYQLNLEVLNIDLDDVSYSSSSSCITVSSTGNVTAIEAGTAFVSAYLEDTHYRDEIEIIVLEETPDFHLFAATDTLIVGDDLDYTVDLGSISGNYTLVSENTSLLSVSNNVISAISSGTASIYATCGEYKSNVVTISVIDSSDNPYLNVNKTAFYDESYQVASSATDAYLRSKAYLMSGLITPQDQKPTTEENRPKSGSKFIHHNEQKFSKDKMTYHVIDTSGEVAFSVYKYGAYVSLKEVAAYVYAFGTIPYNYTESKYAKPSNSPWGEYLRLNHSSFSGNTSKYPYEPLLPDISGEGGNLNYYEIDIGTTGTDCDPSYASDIYNNGTKITRGAARIVYSRYKNKNTINDWNDRYVFYTYNHYNDFQEYLNYEGGWGEMFGNITGGGTISSKTDYNPTDYPEVVRASILA